MRALNEKMPIEFTEPALQRLSAILSSSKTGSGFFGIRIGVVRKGCGGNSYRMDFCTQREEYDDVFSISYNGELVNVLIDKKSMFYLFGTKIDYVQKKLESGFEFYNSNETGRCGCGESFYTT